MIKIYECCNQHAGTQVSISLKPVPIYYLSLFVVLAFFKCPDCGNPVYQGSPKDHGDFVRKGKVLPSASYHFIRHSQKVVMFNVLGEMHGILICQMSFQKV